MESKELLDLCRQHGLDVKNQLSTLNPEQRDAIITLVRNKGAAAATAQKAPVIPPVLQPKSVPNLTGQRPAVLPSRPQIKRKPEIAAPPQRPSFLGETYHRCSYCSSAKGARAHPVAPVPEPSPTVTAPPVVRPSESLPAAAKAPEAPHPPEKTSPPRPQEPPASPPPIRPPSLPSVGGPRTVRTLTPGGQRPSDTGGNRGPLGRGRVPGSGGRPAPVPGGYRVATPPPQKTIRPVEKKEPPAPAGPRKSRRFLRNSSIAKAPSRSRTSIGRSISRTSRPPRSTQSRSFPTTSLTTTTVLMGKKRRPA